MRIFKEKEKISLDFLSKYIFSLKKKTSIKIILFLIVFCFFIFLPIDFFNSSNKGIRYGGEFIAKTIGVFDKKTKSLAREVFYMGDNIFGITFRYFKAFTNKQETLSINLSFKKYQKLAKIRNHEKDLEHVTPYFRTKDGQRKFNVKLLSDNYQGLRPDLDKFFTIDTKTDLIRLENIFKNLNTNKISDIDKLFEVTKSTLYEKQNK